MSAAPAHISSSWLAAAKASRIAEPVHRVGSEERTEEQQFRAEEKPHAQVGRLGLLVEVVELLLAGRSGVGRGVSRMAVASGMDDGFFLQAAPPTPAADRRKAPSVTTGVSSKLCVGGGEVVCHSSPVAPHGLLPAFCRTSATRAGNTTGIM